MDYIQTKPKPPNPRLNTSLVLSLFFTYVRHILKKGNQKELTEDDLYEVLPTYQSKKIGNNLEKEWKNGKSMPKLLWRMYGKEFLLIIFSLIIPILAGVFQQKSMKKFVLYFTKQGKTMTKFDGYYYGLSLVAMLFVNTVYMQNFTFAIQTFTLKMRSGFTSLIYRKILTTDTLQSDVSVGRVINLITRDVNEFEASIYIIICTVRDCLLAVMVCCVLYSEIGWLVLILVSVILLVLLIDVFMSPWTKSTKLKSLKKSDQRYQMTKEFLNYIKLIKMYLWTDKFNEKICQLRKHEMYYTTKLNFWIVFKRIFAESVLKSVWYFLVIASIYFGTQFNAGTLFVIVNSITALQRAMKGTIPVFSQEVASMIAVYTRIGNFLRSVDIHIDTQEHLEVPPKITLSNITVKKGLLKNVNLELNVGLTVVTGPVGSGKSTLLKVIAKEYLLDEGTLTVTRSVSYASQEPWLFPSTIKQNIIFGAPIDEKRYSQVLRVCALLSDLETFKEGDETLLQDRGVNLSKGQQVRINLARAVYRNCDIYLLDDPLSSLDVLVGDYVFKKCIQEFLKDKIVIVVTQNLKYLEASQNVVTVNGGTVESRRQISKIVEEVQISNWRKTQPENEDFDESAKLIQTGKKMYTEPKVMGKVRPTTYKKYVVFGGVWLFLVTVFLRFVIQFLKGTINKSESIWISAEQVIYNNMSDFEKYTEAVEKRRKMTYFFPIILLSAAVLYFLMVRIFWNFCAKASINIHKKLLTEVSHATMEFFDKYLIGTILNRFSEDLIYIDENLPLQFLYCLNTFVELIGIVFVVATVNPIFLVPCLILGTLLLVSTMYYLQSARALKRIQFATRSPILGYLSASLDGLLTIRTSRNQTIVREEFDRHLDVYTSCSYIYFSSQEAFYMFVSTCSVCFVGFVVIFFLILDKSASSSTVGLAVSQTVMFLVMQELLYRVLVLTETNMTATERILGFLGQNQESQKGFEVENWPQKGEIQYHNTSFSYTSDVNVYHNLDFTVKSGEKVAVVGRTGSGKTSLLYSLLRLHKFEGKITIDGVDITTFSLDFYRSKITVVPQDPILFSGTLRDNIDPTGKYTDEEIWNSLKTVRLSTVFGSLDDRIRGVDLDLSLGQKQLICLCRALIRKNKIVVMDELTANVDDETEKMIHEIIDMSFKECTVIMITHKLQYVLSFDKILVLEKGQVSEFGSPFSLLEIKNGTFYKMFNNKQ